MAQAEQKKSEPKLDKEIEASFPASDPPSYTGATVAGGPKQDAQSGEQPAPAVEKECVDVDLNSATEEELGALPALSPKLVRTIVEHRPFTGWEDVKALPEFDGGTIAALKKGGAHING